MAYVGCFTKPGPWILQHSNQNAAFYFILVRVSTIVTLLMVSILVTMVTVSIFIFWASHAQGLLNRHFLPAELHRVNKVVHNGHVPHWGWIPGLDVSILAHQEHWEILCADLEIVPYVFHQGLREFFAVYSCSACAWNKQSIHLFYQTWFIKLPSTAILA